ncbi:hypothetical protein ACIOWI_29670 [Streptomyces sp. NPDC087659]|uniref:hypothetical protein n=1 Tax=Streptomyces sp. NPDC087659 TaxID=3365801 RepID=UPI00382C96D5
MSKKRTGRRISGDPRKSGGGIAGPGGPHDANAVIIDTTDSVLLDGATVSLMGAPGRPNPILAVLLEGRINKTRDRARNLYLMNEDGAAAIVSQVLALAGRMGPEFEARFHERVQQLATEGATRPRRLGDES